MKLKSDLELSELTPTNVQDVLKEAVDSNKIVLFMKGNPLMPQCGFSAQVAEIMTRVGTEYKSFDVLSNELVRNGIKEFGNWPTIPQLYVGGKLVGGCDILTQMFNDGALQTLIEEA